MSKTTIGSASLNLAADDRKLNEGLKRASAEIKGFKAQFSSFSSSFTPITAGIGALGAGLGALGIGKFVGEMIGAASSVEDLLVDFEVMLGSAKEAEQLFGKIKKLADSTPFEPTELANAAKLLLSVGIAASDITGTLEALGDVAGGSAEKFKTVVSVYSKVASSQKAQGDVLAQLADNNISITQNLAKVMGVSVTQVAQLASEGKITFGTFQKAINDATAEGGRFYGFMEKRSRTLSGLISTLKGNYEGLLASVGKIVIEEFGLKSWVAGLAGGLDSASKNAEVLRPLIKELGVSFKGMAFGVMTFGFAVAKSVASVADAVGSIENSGQRLANRFQLLIRPFQTMIALAEVANFELTGKRDGINSEGVATKAVAQVEAEFKKAMAALDSFFTKENFLEKIFREQRESAAREAAKLGGFLGRTMASAIKNSGKINVSKDILSGDDYKRLAAMRDEFDPFSKAKKDIASLQRLDALGGFANDPNLLPLALQKIVEGLADLGTKMDLRTTAAMKDSLDATNAIIDARNRSTFDKPQDRMVAAIARVEQRMQQQIKEAQRLHDLIKNKQIPGIF